MTDFTGKCFSRTCKFLEKPSDQIIKLNRLKVLSLKISHPRGLPMTTSYKISNGGEGIVTLQNNENLDLMAKIPSQLGTHTL
jgi:hypothetical protein